MTLNDEMIRNQLISELHQKHGLHSTYNEVGMVYQNVRLDVLHFHQLELTGYEIKSDLDTIKRLPNQVASYPTMTDKNYLVVGNHLYDEAIAILPDEWGIVRASEAVSGVSLVIERDAIQNGTESFLELLSHCQVPFLKKHVSLLLPESERKQFKQYPKYAMAEYLQNKMAQNPMWGLTLKQILKQGFLNNLENYKPDV